MSNPEMPEFERQFNEARPLVDIANPDERLQNKQELMLASKGLRLRDFAFGDQLVITAYSASGAAGYLKVELIPWTKKQHTIEPGATVRARVKETGFQGFEAGKDIKIRGASLGTDALEGSHTGEIRADCNLLVTPIKMYDFHKTPLAKESDAEVNRLFEMGIIEVGSYGYMVALDASGPPVVLPEVSAVYSVDQQTGVEQRLDWQSAAYLAQM